MHDEKNFHAEVLRTFVPDRRDYDDWAYNDEFCRGLLLQKGASAQIDVATVRHWVAAIDLYWRLRRTRRELADTINLSIDAIKSLLSTIRNAAAAYNKYQPDQSENDGTPSKFNGRVQTHITARQILEFVDGDPEIVAYVEEFRRLSIAAQLKLFDEKISEPLTKTLEQSDALGYTNNEFAVARLIGRANDLKFSVAKDDPFEGRPIFQTLEPREPNYHCDRRGRPRKSVRTVANNNRTGLFFDAAEPQMNLMNTDIESNTENMDYRPAAELIKQYDIPRTTVARLSRMHLSDLSGWLNGRADISQDKIERVTQVVDDIVRVIKAVPYKVDLRDPTNVQKLIVAVNDNEAQIDMFPVTAEQSRVAAD